MRKIYLLLLVSCITSPAFANFITPGTGVKWTLSDLVNFSAGDVTLGPGIYNVNDTVTISTNDTLLINTDETVKFIAGSYLYVLGNLTIDPPNAVLFTAQDISTRFLGLWLDLSNGSVIKKLTLEYANAFRIFDCSPLIEECIFRYNSPVTTFGNAAIALFRSKAIINNCQFIDNMRAAISGGSNIANAPVITNCLFMGNNTLNGNVPQINLGASGTDTTKILNNQILRASTNSGGIGFLPSGTVNTLIRGNIIRNNRYGISLNGSSNINAMISYNIIDSNNTQNNPNLGGSGIAFTGGSTTGQNSIVTGNIFRYNLWGITIQNATQPNLGNINNADTSDDGKNWFINNTNSTTPGIDLYNNSIYNISAQNNYWNTDDPLVIESRIFHQPDNATLGLVDYSGYMVIPVKLTRFTGQKDATGATLHWQTALENNSAEFIVERSLDGRDFQEIGRIAAAGYSATTRNYSYRDILQADKIYYRLLTTDRDGRIAFSQVVYLRDEDALLPVALLARTPGSISFTLSSREAGPLFVTVFAADGKQVLTRSFQVVAGTSNILLELRQALPGNGFIRFVRGRITTTIAF